LVVICGVCLRGEGGGFLFLEEREQTNSRSLLASHTNFQKIATDNAYRAKIRSVPFQCTLLGASGFGKSHQSSALMNTGIVSQVVNATLMVLPMNKASEKFRLARRGLRNRLSSITMGKSPSSTIMAAFQFGGP